jgi:hypothetical protein
VDEPYDHFVSDQQPERQLSDGGRRTPRHEDAIGLLSVVQFFLGGLVLFVVAFTLLGAAATSYDGGLSAIGYAFEALGIAVVSMVVAFLIGLPLRMVPELRTRWLANGELTLAGAALGFVVCVIVIIAAPTVAMTDEIGTYTARDTSNWALLAAWALFAMSVAHFVWPSRWWPKTAR